MSENIDVLAGAWNFRDVADSASRRDAVVRPGQLFRSSDLCRLEDEGREQLRRLGIADVADLRSPHEAERRGAGLLPEGIEVHRLPFVDVAVTDGESPDEHNVKLMMSGNRDATTASDATASYMTGEYVNYPTSKGAKEAVRKVISLIANGRPVLVHCFAGKDRTGFVVAAVLEAAGVSREEILMDYMRSNAAIPQLRARIMHMIRNQSESTLPPEAATFAVARLTDEVLEVRPEYLMAARRAVDDHYGSFQEFLREAAVSERDVARMRSRLLG